MKIQKSNNPLAVGALLCVLALIIGRTIWLVTRGDGSAQMVSAAVTPAAAVSPSQNVMPDSTTPSVPAHSAPALLTAPTTPRSARNPFAARRATPPPAPIAAKQIVTTPVKIHPAATAALTEVRPLPIGPLPALSRPAGPPQTQTAAFAPPAPAPNPLRSIRLTAVIDGTRRMAVLQTTDPQPQIVHEGDTVQGLRVAAIHDTEVVFTRDSQSWTLPMQTADTPVTGMPAETPPTTAQEKNVDATP